MIQTIKTEYYFQLLEQEYGPGWAKRVPLKGLVSGDNPSVDALPGHRGGTTQVMITTDSALQTNVDLEKSTGRLTGLLKIASERVKPKIGKARINSYPLARLVFIEGDPEGQDCFIRNMNPPGNPAGLLEVGRSPSREGRPYILLNHNHVSRKHATIVYQNKRISIINHSQVNPLLINSTILKCDKHVYLPEGAVIHIGPYAFSVEKIG